MLRFGLMCRGSDLPAWQVRCVELLLANPRLELALLIVDARQDRPAGKRAQIQRRARGEVKLWNVYHKLHVRRRSRALRLCDMTRLFADVASIGCRVERRGKFSEHFREEDLAEIRRHDLDFILRFSFGIIRGQILQAARLGVWSFHHGDEQLYRGGPAAFWELYNGDCVTGSILQRLTKRLDAGVVLHRGFFRTSLDSYVRSLDTVLFGSAAWPARVCEAVLAGADAAPAAKLSATKAPIFRSPTNGQFLVFLAKEVWRYLVRKRRSFLSDMQWNVGIVEAPIHSFLQRRPGPVKWLPEPPRRSRFLADPFAATDDGRFYVLLEDFDYRLGQGAIAGIEIAGDGEPSEPRQVLDVGVHASYPCLVHTDDGWYCVPETHQAGEIALYKASEFPWRWERCGTLIEDVAALDPTVFFFQNRWWLLCSQVEEAPGFAAGNADVKLYGWWAESLTGPWHPHVLNPLKTDVRSSRPAGTPFQHEGELYRPAQDVSLGYGSRVVLNRVVELSPTRFEERTVGVVEPYGGTEYGSGLHHLAAAGERTVIDGYRRLFIWAGLKARLTRRTSKLLAAFRRGAGRDVERR